MRLPFRAGFIFAVLKQSRGLPQRVLVIKLVIQLRKAGGGRAASLVRPCQAAVSWNQQLDSVSAVANEFVLTDFLNDL